MLKLKKVAITGGISSGKSQVCRFFAELGATVVVADDIVHQLLTPDTPLGKKVIKLLGTGIIVKDKIDRTRVAKKVFLNPTLLRSLEQLLHPQVYEEIENQYNKISRKNNSPPLFIAEIPLLFETGGEKYFDQTITVTADTETCWERYRKSTGNEREDFSRRRARMLKQEEKAKRADYVIKNNGTMEELRLEVNKLFHILCEEKAKKQKQN